MQRHPIGLMLFLFFTLCGCDSIQSTDAKQVLKGTVTDSSDNLLNGATVTLDPVGVSTQTDANGGFKLAWTSDTPQAPRDLVLAVERMSHVAAQFTIRPDDLGDRGSRVFKLAPLPADDSLIGFTAEMPPHGKEHPGTIATFHVYIPESVEEVRAAFFISRHGMGNITRPILKRFAEEQRVALVGFYGDPVQRGVKSKSVDALDPHLQRLAEMSGHPELKDVPIMTFGHSNGTGFAASWPRDRPARVIAWVSFHPGFTEYITYPNTEKVPAMVMCGSIDKFFLRSRQDKLVEQMRTERNAAMNLMMEGGVGHGPADQDNTWAFIIEFLEAAMRVRLNDDGTVKPVDLTSGWLGDNYALRQGGRQDLSIAPYDAFEGDRSRANWLPDKAFAKAWQDYGRTEPTRANKKQ